MKNGLQLILVVAMTMLLAGMLLAQGKIYEGPDDPAGDVALRREAYMNGNRIRIEFKNNTELSDWPDPEASRWPDDYNGYKYTDGIGLMIASRVFITGDSIPVDNPDDIVAKSNAGLIDTLYYLQTHYREEQDIDPNFPNPEWNMQPVPGYVNENSETPALSNEPDSWPPNGWPYSNHDLHWAGEWDGRFGRGKFIEGGLETYFVANDAQDQEYLPANTLYDGPRYYPRPGHYIGDLRSTSVQNGQPWGGLGIRVEARGFQWSNPYARDCIFWEYNIANISDYNLTEVAFGYWLDNAIGGEGNDRDIGAFNRREDLAYSWNSQGVGTGGRPTGTAGFAYLESPGKPRDGIDNDQDGITDEKRDNIATKKVGPTEGYSDLEWFKDWYNLTDSQLREHWDADEDQDWNDWNDANGNGKYDFGEDPGDDVGIDGVGPGEVNYTGPDLDGTECNHRPDMDNAARKSEPNFGPTDISETDMLGLTMFDMFPVPAHSAPYDDWFRNDQSMWELMSRDSLIPYYETPQNLIEAFATGVFPLDRGRAERVSMSQLYAFDPFSGLDAAREAPVLFKLKKTVQIIYERDYRFAQAPRTPTLKATPGDGQVILTWDNIADLYTREPFLSNENDFEGYKIYRSTDKKLSDPVDITDGYGTALYGIPIFQCDKADGIMDFANYGLINGQGYDLGSDKGLAHSYVDTDVENGRTYYYALVSYDYGIPPERLMGSKDIDQNEGIPPTECAAKIELDDAEEVYRYTNNVAIVTPRPNAAGYISSSSFEIDADSSSGVGVIIPEVMAKDALLPDHTYKVTFTTESAGPAVASYKDHGGLYATGGLQVWDVTNGKSLVYSDVTQEAPAGSGEFKPSLINTVLVEDDSLGIYRFADNDTVVTGIFDGIRLKIFTPVVTAQIDPTKLGWLKGSSPEPTVIISTLEGTKFPWNYQIEFSNDPNFYTGRVTSVVNIKDETGATIKERSEILREQSFSFRCYNTDFIDTTTGFYELMDFLVYDLNKNGQFDMLEDKILVGPVNTLGRWAGTIFALSFRDFDESQLPQNGDVYEVGFNRPWFRNDVIRFSVKYSAGLDKIALDDDMENIKVVPNPYVATNVMEPAIAKTGLNQRRRLMFTHIPSKCTIKIFTVSGVLVDEIRVDGNMEGWSEDKGIVHWDLKSREGLDIAAGIYLYHIKADETGKEKMGKFAVIK